MCGGIVSLSSRRRIGGGVHGIVTTTRLSGLGGAAFRVCTSCVSPLRTRCSRLARSSLLILYLRRTNVSPLTVSLYFKRASAMTLGREGSHLGGGVSR